MKVELLAFVAQTYLSFILNPADPTPNIFFCAACGTNINKINFYKHNVTNIFEQYNIDTCRWKDETLWHLSLWWPASKLLCINPVLYISFVMIFHHKFYCETPVCNNLHQKPHMQLQKTTHHFIETLSTPINQII